MINVNTLNPIEKRFYDFLRGKRRLDHISKVSVAEKLSLERDNCLRYIRECFENSGFSKSLFLFDMENNWNRIIKELTEMGDD